MELLIRSQDKEILLKVDNVRIKHEYEQKKVNDNYGRTCAYINGKYRCSYIYTDSIWLGEYQTKERALEVLDEIQEAKLGNFHYRCPSNAKVSNKEDAIIYEMPKE